MQENKQEKNYTIKNKTEEKREITFEIEVPKDFVNSFRKDVIKKAGKDIEIKGFRKGTAPEKMIIEKIGEMTILEEQAYRAINQIIPQLVMEEEINSISTPKVNVTKISAGDNLEFKTTFTLMPEVKLADYKKIAMNIKTADAVKVEDKEIDDYIDYIRKQRAEAEFMKKKTTGEKVDETDKDKLPELNDGFVKTLGDFKNVEDFKKQLRENIEKDKEVKSKQKRRIDIIEKIIAESEIELPEILIEEEQNRMLHQYRAEIEGMKINFEDYLKEIKKTEEDLKKDWKADAIKRVKMNMILPKIAVTEKIKPDEKKIEKELEHIKEHHKEIDSNQARIYITHSLTNEAVFNFLEELK